MQDPYSSKRNLCRSIQHSSVYIYIADCFKLGCLYFGTVQTSLGKSKNYPPEAGPSYVRKLSLCLFVFQGYDKLSLFQNPIPGRGYCIKEKKLISIWIIRVSCGQDFSLTKFIEDKFAPLRNGIFFSNIRKPCRPQSSQSSSCLVLVVI